MIRHLPNKKKQARENEMKTVMFLQHTFLARQGQGQYAWYKDSPRLNKKI